MTKKTLLITSILSLALLSACSGSTPTTENTPVTDNTETTNAITGDVTVGIETSTPEVKVGEYVKTSINLNTRDLSVNSTQLVFDFDETLLEFDDVSTSKSDFTIWLEKGAEEGKLKLVAAEPNPGISGTKASVAVVTFKAKTPGKTTISLDTTQSKSFTSDNFDVLRSEGHGTIDISIS